MNLFLIVFGSLLAQLTQSGVDDLINHERRKVYHEKALAYCQANNFNTNYYFLVDFSLHSGKNRFFVYDFNAKKETKKGLVTHGSCDVFEPNPTPYEKAKFSNKLNSHCSSLGKYKVGKRDYSSWGINVKYWLHGLESTNNKAQERVVVLHSWSIISDMEIFPEYSALSWGCPAVSDNFMKDLDEMLKKSTSSVLLWIID